MSKFGCTCGHSIIDRTDYLPYKGQVLKEQDHEAFFAGTAESLVEFLAGVRSGDLAEWHRKWPFLRDESDEHVAWSLMGWFWRKFAVDVYECEQCGRLWVQEGTESQRFVPFTPEDASAARVLPSEHFRAASPPDPAEYDEQAELAQYVLRHCQTHFTPFETRIVRADYARRNFTGATDSYGVNVMERYGRLDDEAINKSLEAGIDTFRQTVCERIRKTHPELISRCPKCERIVRTPTAKQCFWCGHDWHN